ncbi:MAG: acyl carrier protein [Coriobacteriales bacterium]|jgi:acyl carrier protein|nr:acyl carrier protein [Coriobacteriales bacterium]
MTEANFETLKRVLVDNLGVEETAVTAQALLQDDLGADSLDAVELIMAIEDEFGLEIDSEQTEKIKTVGDLMTLITSAKS